MRVAAGQFAVTADWRVNARTCVALMNQAAGQGVSLLVLPESVAGARRQRSGSLGKVGAGD
ncbi:Uncharacterised protein [Raoultella planticola]|uniref:Hydrolase n=1 Tax=Raoultella planticola TaxID=575 RepID=A0A485AVM9_RAOPL|nr:Uncharacterised protein [Raoultella planticola]